MSPSLRTTVRRLGTAVAAGVVATVALVACAPASDSGPSERPTLTIALNSAPTSLDPSQGSGGANAIYQDPAYQGLLHIEGNTDITASLASEFGWTDESNQQFQIVLRPNLTFSDGEVLDSAAVKTSIEHFKDGDSVFAYVAANIESIDTPDELTVIFNLSAPTPTFPRNLAEGPGMGMIISPKALEDGVNLGTSTVGAGPYVLSTTGTVDGSVYTYTPNEYYYAPEGIKFGRIVIKVIDNANTALAALKSGQVDVSYGYADTFTQAQSDGLNAVAFPLNVIGMWIQGQDGVNKPALADTRVRQALQYAVDRGAVSEAVSLGAGKPITQLTPEGTLGYDASLEDTYPYDPERAKELLAEAGYADGLELTVTVAPGAALSTLSQALVEQYSKVGVTLTLLPSATFPEYAQAQESGQYDATIVGLGTSGMPSVMDSILSPSGLVNPRHTVFQEVVDAAAAAAALSGDAGSAAWQAVNKLAVDQALVVPITTDPSIQYWGDKVAGVDKSSSFNPVFFVPAL